MLSWSREAAPDAWGAAPTAHAQAVLVVRADGSWQRCPHDPERAVSAAEAWQTQALRQLCTHMLCHSPKLSATNSLVIMPATVMGKVAQRATPRMVNTAFAQAPLPQGKPGCCILLYRAGETVRVRGVAKHAGTGQGYVYEQTDDGLAARDSFGQGNHADVGAAAHIMTHWLNRVGARAVLLVCDDAELGLAAALIAAARDVSAVATIWLTSPGQRLAVNVASLLRLCSNATSGSPLADMVQSVPAFMCMAALHEHKTRQADAEDMTSKLPGLWALVMRRLACLPTASSASAQPPDAWLQPELSECEADALFGVVRWISPAGSTAKLAPMMLDPLRYLYLAPALWLRMHGTAEVRQAVPCANTAQLVEQAAKMVRMDPAALRESLLFEAAFLGYCLAEFTGHHTLALSHAKRTIRRNKDDIVKRLLWEKEA